MTTLHAPPSRSASVPAFTLRPWRPGDEASLVTYGGNRRVSVRMTDRFPYPYTESDARAWIELCGKAGPTENFAIEIDGTAVGGIGLLPKADIFRRTMELGYWLGESYWGQGIMPEAVRRVTDYAFGAFDVIRIYAGVFSSNPASGRVLEKAGYAFEGRQRSAVFKDGEVLDLVVYVRLAEGPPPPS